MPSVGGTVLVVLDKKNFKAVTTFSLLSILGIECGPSDEFFSQ